MFSDTMLTLAGAIFGGLIILHINSYSVIQKKIKAEAIQKLKIDSMIEVINGTKEFRPIINEIEQRIESLTIKSQYYIIINIEFQEVNDAYFQLEKINKILSEKIENFIFLLKRDMIINEEYNNIKKEIENINEVEKIRKSIKEGFAILTDTKYKPNSNNVKFQGIGLVNNAIFDFKKRNPHAIFNQSVEKILKIYKNKLDKEQEGRLKKLLNFLKEINMSNFKEGENFYKNGNYEEAACCWLRALEDAEKPKAAYSLASLYADAGREERAKFFYSVSAKLGNKEAQYELGKIYKEAKFYELAMLYFTKAGEQGHTDARKEIRQIHDLIPSDNPFDIVKDFI